MRMRRPSTGRSVGRWALVFALALQFGCGLAYPLGTAVAVSSSGGGSSASGSNNSPPSIVVAPVARAVGDMTINYQVLDAESDPVDVKIAYSVAGGAFSPAANSRADATSGLASSPAGVSYAFHWDAAADLGTTAAVEQVRVRLTPNDAGRQGLSVVSAAFIAGNDAPVLTLVPLTTTQTGLVILAGELSDSTADAVTLSVEVLQDGGALDLPNGLTVSVGRITELASSRASPGQAFSFAWNTLADMPAVSATVTMTISPSDGVSVGVAQQLSFQLANNGAPAVVVETPTRQRGDIDITIAVFDSVETVSGTASFGDDVALSVVGTARRLSDGATTAVTSLTQAAGTGVSLASLRSSPTGLQHVFTWDSLTDLAALDPSAEPIRLNLTFTPSDSGGQGSPYVVSPFIVGNRAPQLTSLRVLDANDNPTSVVRRTGKVEFALTDSTSDSANVELTYDSAQGRGEATLSSGSLSSLATTSQTATTYTVVWNAVADVGVSPIVVTLTASPSDVATGASVAGVESVTTVTVIGDEAPVLSNFAALDSAGSVSATAGGVTTLRFDLSDAEADVSSVLLTYESANHPSPTAIAVVIGTTSALATTATGTIRHTVGWNTIGDLGAVVEQVTLTATPFDAATGTVVTGLARTYNVLVINNDEPVFVVTLPQEDSVKDLRLPNTPVPITFLALDPQGGVVSTDVEVRAWGVGQTSFHSVATGVTFAASPQGVLNTYDYDPRLDTTLTSGSDVPRVQVRFTNIRDASLLLGDPVTTELFHINLNNEPVVLVLGGVGPSGSASENVAFEGIVAVSYQVSDAETDLVELTVEVSSNGIDYTVVTPTPTAVVATHPNAAPVSVTFTMDTLALGLGLMGPTTVRLRVTPRDQLALASVADEVLLGSGEPATNRLVVDNSGVRPLVVVQAVSGIQSRDVEVSYTLTDLFGYPCDVTVSYSIDETTFYPATASASSWPVTDRRASPQGDQDLFTWDSLADLQNQHIRDDEKNLDSYSGVTLRIQATTKPIPGSGIAPRTSIPGGASQIGFELDNAWQGDLVIGHADLTLAAVDNIGLDGPRGVTVTSSAMWICDTKNNRVLQYYQVPRYNAQGADVVLGQNGFSNVTASSNVNDRSGMNAPTAVVYDEQNQRLYVADQGGENGRGRVLRWTSLPTRNGQEANQVIAFSVPMGISDIAVSGDDLYVAAANLDVVIRYRVARLSGGEFTPDLILTGTASGDFGAPAHVEVIAGGGIVVSDAGNNQLAVWTSRPSAATADFTVNLPSGHSPEGLFYRAGLSLAELFVVARNKRVVVHYKGLPLALTGAGDFATQDFKLGEPASLEVNLNFHSDWIGDVAGAADVLVVTDSLWNRALIYNPLPTSNVSAFAIVGQSAATTSGSNNAAVSAFELNKPSGLRVVDNSLYVADTRNRRVLIWNTMPTAVNRAADLVLGQPDFETAMIKDPLTARDLAGPKDIEVAGDKLIVADGGSGRLLLWTSLPTVSYQAADWVIAPVSATSVVYHEGRKTLVACEPDNNRVLVWEDLDLTDSADMADLVANPLNPVSSRYTLRVLGQRDLVTTVSNTAALTVDAQLYAPSGVWLDGDNLFIADALNQRVLRWQLPLTQTFGQSAASVVGRSSLTDLAPRAAARDTLVVPVRGFVSEGRMFVMDWAGQRLCVWDSVPTASGIVPDRLFGQQRWLEAIANRDGVSARTLYLYQPLFDEVNASPEVSGLPGVAPTLIDGQPYMWISDTNNNRIVRVPIGQ